MSSKQWVAAIAACLLLGEVLAVRAVTVWVERARLADEFHFSSYFTNSELVVGLVGLALLAAGSVGAVIAWCRWQPVPADRRGSRRTGHIAEQEQR